MLAIIDGDVLAYQSCKPRWQTKAKITNGMSYVNLDQEGKKIPFEYTKEENAEYLERSWENFKKGLDKMLGDLFATDYLIAVKGPNNFRDMVYPEYKKNRKNQSEKMAQITPFVPIIRQLAVKEGYAVEARGREADDLVRIWANEAERSNDPFVICSCDKDLLCIPGKHYLMHKDKIITVSPMEARRNYFEQLLKGDMTDNIPGIPGIGPVKAERMVKECTTLDELQELIVGTYIEAYGDDWESFLLSNGKMIHIQGHIDDYFTIGDWPIVKELRG